MCQNRLGEGPEPAVPEARRQGWVNMSEDDAGPSPGELPNVLWQLLSYWNNIKGKRLIPSRRDFDPVQIPRLLPHLILVEVIRDTADFSFQDFRFRLVGSYVDERMRDRYVGRRLSEIEGKGPGTAIWETYQWVERKKMPKSISLNYVGPMNNIKNSQEIFLPLSSNGSRVDYILVGLKFV